MSKKEDEEPELPFTWKQIQSAIWLIGLAILFYTDKFWPGILVLVAISGLFQAFVVGYLNRQKEAQAQVGQSAALQQERANWLPATCPKCGAPISVETVTWTGANTADCPYCKANLKPE